MDIKINLVDTNYNNAVIRVKNHIVEWAANNNVPIPDVNTTGSNINTLIHILAYFYIVFDIKLDLYVNEFFLTTATLPNSILNLSKQLGFTPPSKQAAEINVKVVDRNTVPITIPAGTYIYLYSKLNSSINFYYQIQENTVLKTTFKYKQGTYYPPLSFIIDNSIAHEANYVVLPHKWEIDVSTLKVTHQANGTTINWIELNQDTDIQQNINSYIYSLDYSSERGLILRFPQGYIGKYFYGTINVSYFITTGSTANGISVKDLKLKFIGSADGYSLSTIPDINKFEIIYDNEVFSIGGNDEISLENIKYLAPLFYKSQNRLVDSNDFYYWLGRNLPGYLHRVFGGDEISSNIQPGKAFICVWKYTNNMIVDYSWDAVLKQQFIDKMITGIVPVFINVIPANISIDTTITVNNKYNGEVITRIIDNKLLDLVNNNPSYINSNLLQQKIFETGVRGLVDFEINSLSITTTINSPKPIANIVIKSSNLVKELDLGLISVYLSRGDYTSISSETLPYYVAIESFATLVATDVISGINITLSFEESRNHKIKYVVDKINDEISSINQQTLKEYLLTIIPKLTTEIVNKLPSYYNNINSLVSANNMIIDSNCFLQAIPFPQQINNIINTVDGYSNLKNIEIQFNYKYQEGVNPLVDKTYTISNNKVFQSNINEVEGWMVDMADITMPYNPIISGWTPGTPDIDFVGFYMDSNETQNLLILVVNDKMIEHSHTEGATTYRRELNNIVVNLYSQNSINFQYNLVPILSRDNINSTVISVIA